ncbi:MAG: pyridoxamine 5'-phosphate oxidase family protein [Pseudodesulfovibrio sp.]
MQTLDALILSSDMCVLATSDGLKPHASLMHYFLDHAAMKFYFLSPAGSRKNRNLALCPHVSMVIDRRDEDIAATIEGVYSPITKKQTAEAITNLFVLRHPQFREFAQRPDTVLIRIEARAGHLVTTSGEQFSTKFRNS